MFRFALVALLLCSCAVLSSCAHTLPQTRCDDVVDIVGPDDAAVTIARACEQFADSSGISPNEVRRALRGTRVEVMEWRREPPCERAPGCVYLGAEAAKIYVGRTHWRHYLSHEIYHVLLARLEPNLPAHRHHFRMRNLKLCGANGGCGHVPPMCRGATGGWYDCDSALR